MNQEKHFYTISEVSELCDVKAHVLRYWEKEFDSLQPSTRRGKRRYYQAHDIQHIQTIKRLLYDEGFTISGAKARIKADVSKNAAKIDANTKKDGSAIHTTLSQLDEILALLD